jgi:putative ABC transport system ATP-binding protein
LRRRAWQEWLSRPKVAADCILRRGARSGPLSYQRSPPSSYNQGVQPIISASNLNKIYHAGKIEVPALRNISFAIEPGEFVSVVGPSGSGKSTLFYVLGGLTHATSGSVKIDNVDFASLSDAGRTQMRKSKIGFVFQKFNLLPTLSAIDNIDIAYDISGRTEPLDKDYLASLTDLLGISGRLQHRPSELSGGEQQRVAIARALITRPAIVLADEPTGNLDTKNSEAVLKMLQRSNREFKQTVLMITHNPEAASIADRILHMRDGEIVNVEKGAGASSRAVPNAASSIGTHV